MTPNERSLTSAQCYENADRWFSIWLRSLDPRDRARYRYWEVAAHRQFAAEELTQHKPVEYT